MNNDQKYVTLLIKIGIIIGACGIFYISYYFIFPAIGEVVRFLLPILAPFALGALIAALVEPTVNYMEKKLHMNRNWAVLLTISFLMAVIISFIVIGISRLTVELVKLSRELPKYTSQITSYVRDILSQLRNLYDSVELSPQVIDGISQSVSNFIVILTNSTSNAADLIVGVSTVLPNFLLILLIGVIASYFISRDRHILANVFARFLPSQVYEALQAISVDMGKAIFGYLRAQLILVSITGLQTVIGLYIIGIDYAITVGIVVGLVDFVPYLGPGAIFVPWIIYTAIMDNLFTAGTLTILYLIIIMVRQILEPKIVAENIGLHPLATLMSMYVGFKIFGVLGVVLGPIVLVIIKAVSRGNIFSRWM